MGPQEILIGLAVTMMLIFRRSMMEVMMKAIEDFRNNFPGGPTTPMHPSPSNDSALLRRRRAS